MQNEKERKGIDGGESCVKCKGTNADSTPDGRMKVCSRKRKEERQIDWQAEVYWRDEAEHAMVVQICMTLSLGRLRRGIYKREKKQKSSCTLNTFFDKREVMTTLVEREREREREERERREKKQND